MPACREKVVPFLSALLDEAKGGNDAGNCRRRGQTEPARGVGFSFACCLRRFIILGFPVTDFGAFRRRDLVSLNRREDRIGLRIGECWDSERRQRGGSGYERAAG
ncbi:MAG: hypothetical protein ACRECV_10355 [Xanthobacteraceae bacterium]